MNDETKRQGDVTSAWSKLLWLVKRLFLLVLALIAGYLLIVLVGLIPVNNEFDPSQGKIRIRVVSSPVHADFMLPISNQVIDWRTVFPADCFPSDTSKATHLAVGWGDRGFFLETPTWADIKVSTTAKAMLWPSESCMHVVMAYSNYGANGAREVFLTEQQYTELVEFIRQSFRRNKDDELIQIPDFSYHNNDAFFEARGSYNCLNTCNSWTGRGLKECGVRVPWLTPLPKSIFLYLPDLPN